MIYSYNKTKESSTVHTAIGICHTGYADCLLASGIRMELLDPASQQSP